MKTKIFLLLITFLLINFVIAQSFCVDFDPPSAPSNLVLTESNGNIQLIWDVATDEPDCSGISHYDVYRGKNGGNLELIKDYLENTNYLDTGLSYGTYTYIIHAWDLAGHNEGNGILKSITISAPGENGVTPTPSGGSNGRITSYWQCGKWSECINGTQKRVCEDIFGSEPNRTETKECFPNFVSGQNNETISLDENQEGQTTNFLTGAVIGVGNFAKSGAGALTLSVLVLTALAVVTVLLRKKMEKKLFKEPESESTETE